MSNERVWNDETRRELREGLQSTIVGELRMAKDGHEGILQYCHDRIVDDCPEAERDRFIQFAADEIVRAQARLDAERATWPDETDCDRLDRVEAALRERGIVFWQVSPCCDTCSGAELPDRIDVIDDRYPGFRDRVRGYAFFIDQNVPEMLAESTRISVYLAYGWFSSSDEKVPPNVYETKALDIASEICECLRNEGFEPDWNGDFARKIGISVDWRRRRLVE